MSFAIWRVRSHKLPLQSWAIANYFRPSSSIMLLSLVYATEKNLKARSSAKQILQFLLPAPPFRLFGSRPSASWPFPLLVPFQDYNSQSLPFPSSFTTRGTPLLLSSSLCCPASKGAKLCCNISWQDAGFAGFPSLPLLLRTCVSSIIVLSLAYTAEFSEARSSVEPSLCLFGYHCMECRMLKPNRVKPFCLRFVHSLFAQSCCSLTCCSASLLSSSEIQGGLFVFTLLLRHLPFVAQLAALCEEVCASLYWHLCLHLFTFQWKCFSYPPYLLAQAILLHLVHLSIHSPSFFNGKLFPLPTCPGSCILSTYLVVLNVQSFLFSFLSFLLQANKSPRAPTLPLLGPSFLVFTFLVSY